METLMVERVQSSLLSFMNKNAIFLCERLCAQFPSELNLQLLATCYLRNNQAYCSYHILKGARMPQSRYLFAYACFQMNLLREAEAALCPVSELNSEVPSGAAGHYLLGLIYRYTGRRSSAVDHFIQALTIDPLLWSAYEELCVLGAAEEAKECFSDSSIAHIQHQQLSDSSSQNLNMGNEDRNVPSSRFMSTGDSNPRQSKQHHVNNMRDSHGIAGSRQSSNSALNLSQYNTPSPTTMQDTTTRKVIGTGREHGLCIPDSPVSTFNSSANPELWHRRLGHPSSTTLKHLVSGCEPSFKVSDEDIGSRRFRRFYQRRHRLQQLLYLV